MKKATLDLPHLFLDDIHCTVEPHQYGHPWDWANVTLMKRRPYYRGLNCTLGYNMGLSQGDPNGEVPLITWRSTVFLIPDAVLPILEESEQFLWLPSLQLRDSQSYPDSAWNGWSSCCPPSFSEHIFVRTSLPRCLCEIDVCPPPLCLLLPSYQTYQWCLSPIFVLAFLCFFSRLPFLALSSSLNHCGE